MMRSSRHAIRFPFLLLVAAFVIFAAGLREARPLLVPLLTAGFLSFILTPPTNSLQRRGVGRGLSVAVVVFLTLGAVGFAGYLTVNELGELGEELPRHGKNIRTKVAHLEQSVESAFDRLRQFVPRHRAAVVVGGGEVLPPTAEEVATPFANAAQLPFSFLTGMLHSVAEAAASIAFMLLLTVVLLYYRENVRDRLVSLFGEAHLPTTTEAFDKIGGAISRYLLMQLFSNLCFAMPVTIVMMLVGLPNALLWGVLAVAFRFVPYIGGWMSALPPILLAFAVFDDWYRPLIIIAGFGITDLLVASLLEPIVFGHATGITPLGVLISSAFWVWLWGPVGLILATPISVSLVVLGRYIPELRLLGVLFADSEQLSAAMRVYQRVLAGDVEQARTVIAGERVSEPDRVKIATTVFLPSMVAAARDYRRGRLTQERFRHATALFNKLAPALLETIASEEPMVSDRGRQSKIALCTLGGHPAEQLLLEPIAAFLEERSFEPETISYKLLTGEVLSSIDRGAPKVVLLSMLPLLSGSFTRYRFKRISRRFPKVPIVLAVWNDGDRSRYERYFHHPDLRFASTYEEALQEIERAAAVSPVQRSAVG